MIEMIFKPRIEGIVPIRSGRCSGDGKHWPITVGVLPRTRALFATVKSNAGG